MILFFFFKQKTAYEIPNNITRSWPRRDGCNWSPRHKDSTSPSRRIQIRRTTASSAPRVSEIQGQRKRVGTSSTGRAPPSKQRSAGGLTRFLPPRHNRSV